MRECAGCVACCTLTRVPELDKPYGVTCCHVCDGCAIYSERPQSCRDFRCAWLNGEMPDWMRPDKAHVMLERINDHLVIALPEPGYERTWLTPQVNALLKSQYQDNGGAVAARGAMLLPDGISAESVQREIAAFAASAGVVR